MKNFLNPGKNFEKHDDEADFRSAANFVGSVEN